MGVLAFLGVGCGNWEREFVSLCDDVMGTWCAFVRVVGCLELRSPVVGGMERLGMRGRGVMVRWRCGMKAGSIFCLFLGGGLNVWGCLFGRVLGF